MTNDVRPENMERITTESLAKAFIDEQTAALRAEIGDKKVLLALSGGVAGAEYDGNDRIPAEEFSEDEIHLGALYACSEQSSGWNAGASESRQ